MNKKTQNGLAIVAKHLTKTVKTFSSLSFLDKKDVGKKKKVERNLEFLNL